MVCICHMVSEKKPFTSTDYEELMDPQNHVERVILNETNIFAYLESLGYDSTKLVSAQQISKSSYDLFCIYFCSAIHCLYLENTKIKILAYETTVR